jgi:uncharacterized protein (UPF0276 family)
MRSIGAERTVSTEGVGLGYHPFLHEALIARVDACDFIELPLDLYIDPARSALLDPMDARLRDIAAARPCVWRGSALSLGSVERPDDPTPDPFVIERIQRLMDRTGATQYSDVIGFRRLDGRDIGEPQTLPFTESAARWTAARFTAARDALGHSLSLQPAGCQIVSPRFGNDLADFLSRIVALAGCDLALDMTDLERIASATGDDPSAMVNRLPLEHVTMLACSGAHEAEWALLSRVAAITPARAIVIRRTRDLFPLDAIVSAADRARDILPRKRDPAAEPLADPLADEPDGLAALRSYQARTIDLCLGQTSAAAETRLATHSRAWQAWHERVAETHKARQIAQFLAEDMALRQRG